jgi:hypothetical protein
MDRLWKDDREAFSALLSELANSLQTCVGLSALVRQQSQQHADDSRSLERQISRAAHVVKRLSNEDGAR